MLVTLPFVLWLIDFWPCQRWRLTRPATSNHTTSGPERTWYFLIAEKVPLLAMAACFCHIAWQSQSSVRSADAVPLMGRILNAIVSVVAYLGDTICPTRLALFYPHSMVLDQRITSELVIQAVFAAIALLSIVLLVFALRHGRAYLVVGWLWFLGTLVPVMGLVQLGAQARADRYTYIPSIGLTMLMVWGAGEWLGRRQRGRPMAVTAATLVLVSLALSTWFQVGYWSDSLTLFEHARRVTGRNYFAYNHLGLAHNSLDQPEEARLAFEQSIRLRPGYDVGHNNLAIYYAHRGDTRTARHHLEQALQTNPEHVDALSNLGVICAMQGQLGRAAQCHLQAIDIAPQHPDSHYNLGVVYSRLRRWEDAARSYEQALHLNPAYSAARQPLGTAYLSLRRFQEAAHHLHLAGTDYLQQGDYYRAQRCFTTVLRVNPQHAQARQSLSLLAQQPMQRTMR